ncbi:MAG: ester cyclase [Myxococcota bacterium]|nr:ester cyclase [Myxococcota bacterium]
MADPTGEEIVRNVIACDNARDAAGYRSLLHAEYQSIVHGQPATTGPEEEVAQLERWWLAASDVRLEPLDLYAAGTSVTLRYTLAGTNDGEFFGQPATGKRFQVENCTLFEISEGQVRRAWRYSDTLGLMTQLGLLPVS